MAQILHYGGGEDLGSNQQKVFLATPCYGDVKPAFAYSLMAACVRLEREGIAFEVELYAGNCHVDDSRNRLVRDFLESNCTDMLFLDADLRFEPADIVALLKPDRDVVAGAYPLKQEDESYPVFLLNDEPELDEEGLLEVKAAPTGCMRIRRHVLEFLACKSPGFPAKNDHCGRRKIPIVFERILEESTRMGGDVAFCWKWRQAGGKIYVLPSLRFVHYGDCQWSGMYSSYLKRNSGKGYTAEINAIRQGAETERDLIELVQGWGNDKYAAPPELLKAAILLARDSEGAILECGSGLSTLCMAAATAQTVHAMEHDPTWMQVVLQNAEKLDLHNVRVHYCPLEDKGPCEWYSLPNDLPNEFSMLLCDGPPRKTRGHRTGVLEIAPLLKEGATVLFDDYEDIIGTAILQKMGIEFSVMGIAHPFAVGRRTTNKPTLIGSI